jgi:hypothetical protein
MRSSVNLKRIALKFVIILFCSLILGVLGMFIGALIGGNIGTGFQFLGVRGYEATGQAGFILGAALGALISWRRIKDK